MDKFQHIELITGFNGMSKYIFLSEPTLASQQHSIKEEVLAISKFECFKPGSFHFVIGGSVLPD